LQERLGMREEIEGKHAVSDQNGLNPRTIALEFEIRTSIEQENIMKYLRET
jgi:hypothetical protein